MSTLKATNIKNESSASNNIVLDSGGGAIFSGVTTFSSSVNFNSIGSLTLGTGTTIGAATSNTFTILTNGNERVRVDSLGDVGIGTTNPQYTLDVAGDINLTGTFRQNGSQFVASRWTSGTGDDIYRLSGDVGIGTTNPQSTLHLQANQPTLKFTETDANLDNKNWNITASAQEFYLQALTDANSGGGNLFKFTRSNEQIQTFEGQNSAVTWFKVDNNTQRVGIGTTNPQQALHVVGVVTATSYRGDGSQLSGISVGTDITSCLFT